MRPIRAVSEDEMILAFLRAELDSPRFRDGVSVCLAQCGGTESMITAPRLDDPNENRVRRCVLRTFRGYGQGNYLFPGFPPDVSWELVAVDRAGIATLLYANWPTWVELSGGSRFVGDGAANLDAIEVEDINVNVRGLLDDLRNGRRSLRSYEPAILAARHPNDQHVIAEGHTRLTAYCINLDPGEDVNVIVGYSARMREWKLFGLD